jgi:RNA polymerase sigma-70 factor (ECF subfamily)
MPERSDDDLVREYLKGDFTAFEILYTRYRARLFSFVRSMGGSGPEAEDLFQETWLRAIRGLRRYRPRGRFRIWLFTIARNLFLDRARKQRKEIGAYDEEAPAGTHHNHPVPRPDEKLLGKERESLLRHAIEQLAPDERQVLELRTREEMSFREIAQVLDIPVGTALWRMHSAVKRLAAFCREEEIPRPGKTPGEGKRT